MSGGKAFWLILGVLVFGIRSLESLNPTDIYKLLATPPGADPGFSERGSEHRGDL